MLREKLLEVEQARARIIACFGGVSDVESWTVLADLVVNEIECLRAMVPGEHQSQELRAAASPRVAVKKRVPLKYNLEGPSVRFEFHPPPGADLVPQTAAPAPSLVTWEAQGGRSEPGYFGQEPPLWVEWWGFFYAVPQANVLVTCKQLERSNPDVVAMPAKRGLPLQPHQAAPGRPLPPRQTPVNDSDAVPSMPAVPAGNVVAPSAIVDADQLMAELEGGGGGAPAAPQADTEPKTDPSTPNALGGSQAPTEAPPEVAPEVIDAELVDAMAGLES